MQQAHQAGQEDEMQPWPDLECATGYHTETNWQGEYLGVRDTVVSRAMQRLALLEYSL